MKLATDFLPAYKAADFLGVSRSTFYRCVRNRIPRHEITPFTSLYLKRDLEEYAASQRVVPTEAKQLVAA